jgi:hypothetical protein
METIRRTEPMRNVNYDQLFEDLYQEDLRDVQMLRKAIMAQIQQGKWD